MASGENVEETLKKSARFFDDAGMLFDDVARQSDDAVEGLAQVVKKGGDTADDAVSMVKKYLARGQDDVVEATFRGIQKDIIDLDEVNPGKLAGYIEDYGVKTGGRSLVDDVLMLQTKFGDDVTEISNKIIKNDYVTRDGIDATSDIFDTLYRASKSSPVDTNTYGGKTLGQIVGENGMTMNEWNVFARTPRDALPPSIQNKIDNIVLTVKNSESEFDAARFINGQKMQTMVTNDIAPTSFYTRYDDVANVPIDDLTETLRLADVDDAGYVIRGNVRADSCQIPDNLKWPGTNNGVSSARNGRTAFEYTPSGDYIDFVPDVDGVYAKLYKTGENVPLYGLKYENGKPVWKLWSEIIGG